MEIKTFKYGSDGALICQCGKQKHFHVVEGVDVSKDGKCTTVAAICMNCNNHYILSSVYIAQQAQGGSADATPKLPSFEKCMEHVKTEDSFLTKQRAIYYDFYCIIRSLGNFAQH